jgi:hypothetical protein|tara:strand:- start:624 stop:950 length:327 start_codon:yes stop_codon:yes gene_type:complete
MVRDHAKILLSDTSGNNFSTPINNYNDEKGLFGIDTVPIGCPTVWPFGDYQTHHDMRKRQMENKTILNTYKGWRAMGKGYIIIMISKGIIHGVPNQFNGNLMLLQRVH